LGITMQGGLAMPVGLQPEKRGRALADIPVVLASDAQPAKARVVAPPSRATQEPYRAYKPRPFARAERDKVTILFGNLHWRAERVMQGALANLGYRTQILPTATRADLLTGREVADIGQCCPTSFTVGNIVNALKHEAQSIGPEQVAEQFVYLTAGSCGACRFGQYHQSYELALRNSGMQAFRMFLLGQEGLDQGEANGGGLDLNLPLTLGAAWSVLLADVVQDLEYQTRPYEIEPGATERASRDAVEILYQALLRRPQRGRKLGSIAWHLATPYFVNAVKDVRRRFDEVEVDRLRVKPKVKITGEFYLQTVEGDPNYNIHRWLEAENAEVYPAVITVWFDYLMRMAAQDFEDHVGINRGAYLKAKGIHAAQRLLRWTYDRMRNALGGVPHELPAQTVLRDLARPYYHSRLNGGEGDMLIGKALWAHQQKKAHMICELSPYGCMPNTMSIGAMAAVQGRHPDLLYAPLEIKGDAEVHALSRCQMILTEARRRAQKEFEEVMARTGLSVDALRGRETALMRRATYRVPHLGVAGTAANYALHLSRC
jgi:predicted nucleotide-binding protein (sugar kinase/HSP70/actin superfamily)